MSLGKFIQERRTTLRLSLQDIAERLEVSRSTVSDWEHDKMLPRPNRLVQLAAMLETSVDTLWSHLSDYRGKPPVFGQSNGKEIPTIVENNVVEGVTARPLPVISWVQAGVWDQIMDKFQAQDAEKWVLSPFSNSEAAFVLRVIGQSMFNPGGDLSFREGDYISVDPRLAPRNESFVIFKRASEPAVGFRQLLIEGDGAMLLHALNPSWPTRYTQLDSQTSIVGVVTGQWREL